MSQHGDNNNFILGDDSENNPNFQNLTTALIVIGWTAHKPYRPYTSFTPHNQDERHSSHSLHCSNITSLQSTTPAGPSYGHTESLSPPATVPFMPTGHSSIPIASLDTSTSLVHPSSLTTAQVTTPDTSLNDAHMDDASMDDELPCHANCEIYMDQDMPTATLLPLMDPVTHPNPTTDIPTGSGRHKALPLPSITENYLGQLVNQQFAQLSNKKYHGTSKEDRSTQGSEDKHLLQSKTGSLPQSPLSQAVQAFTNNNENPPSLDNIAIDWRDFLRSSLWNTEVINLMVVDFQQKIQTDRLNTHKHGLDVDGMSRDETDTAIGVKLKIMRSAQQSLIYFMRLSHMCPQHMKKTYQFQLYDDAWYKVNASGIQALLDVCKDFKDVYHSVNDIHR
ncbi:hypothetical protein BD769DRAFT_1396842 [Suillus cothurnatus]|nr:hypothetical protein BD769DRAFT_1396842 [Suillus cothurnatus]